MKQKTHSGLKKRIKVKSKNGKLKLFFEKASHNHLLINKSKSQKRQIAKKEVPTARLKAVRRLLPHAG